MRFVQLPEELKTGVDAACDLLGELGGMAVRFEKAGCLHVRREGDGLVIGYSRKAEALRGLSMAKRVWSSGEEICQKSSTVFFKHPEVFSEQRINRMILNIKAKITCNATLSDVCFFESMMNNKCFYYFRN